MELINTIDMVEKTHSVQQVLASIVIHFTLSSWMTYRILIISCWCELGAIGQHIEKLVLL